MTGKKKVKGNLASLNFRNLFIQNKKYSIQKFFFEVKRKIKKIALRGLNGCVSFSMVPNGHQLKFLKKIFINYSLSI